tara:strand:+ start:40 stop:606 length:567 start_codon:yes stop_codon:yes gene_type:complete
MSDKEIVKMYKDGNSMRSIAKKLSTNHKLISRILKRENTETRKPLNLRGVKKFNCNIERKYNNMATHLRFDVSAEWLMQFKDFEKLKTLNNVITNRSGRYDENTKWYISYLNKFYNDNNFNLIYERWEKSNFEKYKKPSLDHIVPTSKGGTNKIENLQFLSWFENRCKNDMTQKEWSKLKQNINNYFI